MPTVGLPKHAIKAVELGADVVTVQGGEGGGHTGAIPTTLLIPQVIDAVGDKVPVVAAGGFKDGRGLLAALILGFGRALGEFGATMLVAGDVAGETRTLSIAIFDHYQQHEDGQSLQLVGVTLLLAFALLFFAERLSRGSGVERT